MFGHLRTWEAVIYLPEKSFTQCPKKKRNLFTFPRQKKPVLLHKIVVSNNRSPQFRKISGKTLKMGNEETIINN